MGDHWRLPCEVEVDAQRCSEARERDECVEKEAWTSSSGFRKTIVFLHDKAWLHASA
jgi:hypothetical protein